MKTDIYKLEHELSQSQTLGFSSNQQNHISTSGTKRQKLISDELFKSIEKLKDIQSDDKIESVKQLKALEKNDKKLR